MKLTCKTCAYASWIRTPTGRIMRNVAGTCTYPETVWPVVPECQTEPQVVRMGIWPEDNQDCQCHSLR